MSLILSGTDGLSDVDGSAATPAIRGTDANTGIFFPAADTIAFSEGGVEIARFDSSGNLGIGTSSPAYKLDVTGTIRGRSDQYLGFVSGSQAGVWWAQTNYSVPSFQGLTSAGNVGNIVMQLGGANVGIGTASPAVKLEVQADLSANTEIARFSHSTADIGRGAKISLGVSGYPMAQLEGFADSAGNGSLRFYTYTSTTTTEKARIDSSGNLLVGTTSVVSVGAGAHILSLRASSTSWGVGPTSSFGNFYVKNGGSYGVVLTTTATSWASDSDERKKTTITPFENAINKICSIRAGTGRYLTDEESMSRSFLIAQDVQSVLPEAVDVGEDVDQSLMLRYTDVIPLLVAAIQEQQALIQSLTARITALETP
jgi:hypothetical protein